jgi:hypothetical protein
MKKQPIFNMTGSPFAPKEEKAEMGKPMKITVKKGALHKDLGVKKGQKIPASKLAIKASDSALEKKRKIFAQNAKKWRKN